MNHIKLYERFVIPKPAPMESLKRLRSIGPQESMYGLKMMYYWFAGRMMHVDDEMDDVVNIFRKIGSIYKERPEGKHLYRAIHIHLERPGMSVEEILDINHAVTGPKQLQSWSTSEKGAQWFFDRFVRQQNKHDAPVPNAAWVIARVDAADVEKLITFEECLEFMSDLELTNLGEDVDGLINWLNNDDMLKLHEFICYTPKDCPIKIMDVLVPPQGSEEHHRQHRRAA